VKVAINCRRVLGAWGGGNRAIGTIEAALEARGDAVVYDLADRDIDVILIVDPRRRNPQLSFMPGQALDYVLGVRRQCTIVHRINECDARKGTHTMDFRLRVANYCADHTVFVASWLKDCPVWRRESPSSVILGGGDDRIFRRDSALYWQGEEPLRLVTHHWGANKNKGLDVYSKLDDMLGTPPWKDRVAFTYIGNRPAGLSFRNSDWLPPLDGAPLAEALARNHAYLTASLFEPSGNHHIEGALLGMPILYRRSGGLPEYCAPYGVGFDGPDDFEPALTAFIAAYATIKPTLGNYPHTSARMAKGFLDLFDGLLANASTIAAARRPWRDPIARILNWIAV
jgi:hypothetical protein